MKHAIHKSGSSSLAQELPASMAGHQEFLALGAIALITTLCTMGTLYCLFDRTQCVHVSSSGEINVLQGFKNCAPSGLH
jgi:hypothetical protein